ncbi:MAG: hypothetical protein ACRC6L_06710 [Steroidobacteraceae bacterium]
MRSGWLLLALFAVLQIGAARAATTAANLAVSAQVLPHAHLQVDTASVTVSAADVQRGFLDVSRQYRLRTNAPDRVVLQLNPRLGLTESIDVRGLQALVRIGDTGLEISQPLQREFALSYRLWLSAAATPGRYALPVQAVAVIR